MPHLRQSQAWVLKWARWKTFSGEMEMMEFLGVRHQNLVRVQLLGILEVRWASRHGISKLLIRYLAFDVIQASRDRT